MPGSQVLRDAERTSLALGGRPRPRRRWPALPDGDAAPSDRTGLAHAEVGGHGEGDADALAVAIKVSSVEHEQAIGVTLASLTPESRSAALTATA